MITTTIRKKQSLLIITLGCGFSASLSYAQISLDGTLGPSGDLVGPNFFIPAEVGQQVGGNLFHSFGEFNVNTGESAIFTGPDSVDNVIGRVTGGQQSLVDGVLSVQIPDADLYLINPAGIMFGENARLDVPGSFHVSTADYLRLGQDGLFDARNPENSSLTVASVSAFGFYDDEPGIVSLQDGFLLVPDRETLSVIGGDINVASGNLLAFGGRINLVATDSAGEVALTETGLQLEGFDRLGTIEITHTLPQRLHERLGITDFEIANVDVSSEQGGAIFVRGDQLTVDNAWLFADNVGLDGRGIDIDVDGRFSLAGFGLVTAETLGEGSSGNIRVQADSIEVLDRARISTSTLGAGDGGDVDINARTIDMSGGDDPDRPAGFFSDTNQFATGAGGDLRIEADRITMDNGALIRAASAGPGQSGSVTVLADNLKLDKGSQIGASTAGSGQGGAVNVTSQQLRIAGDGILFTGLFADTLGMASGSGAGGNLTVQAQRLELSNGAQISVSTMGPGQGGMVDILTDSFFLSDENSSLETGVFANTSGQGPDSGDGGNLRIRARDLELRNGAQIGAATAGVGNGGNVNVVAQQMRLFGDEADFTGLFADTLGLNPNSGAGGNLTVQTQTLDIQSGAQINANSLGSGSGGTIEVVTDQLSIASDNGDQTTGIFATARGQTLDSGAGGNLRVAARDVELRNGGQIGAATVGPGQGGTVNIMAQQIRLIGDGVQSTGLFANTLGTGQASGNGGNIIVNTQTLDLQAGAQISASTAGSGRGGTIEVAAHRLSLSGDNNSLATGIFANADGQTPDSGAGGNLQIEARELEIVDGAQIGAATSGPGRGGSIDVTAEQILLNGDGAGIQAVANGSGNAGDIVVHTNLLQSTGGTIASSARLASGGEIEVTADNIRFDGAGGVSASVLGSFDTEGGNIAVNTENLVLFDTTQIVATATQGLGGNILVNADIFLRDAATLISASSEVAGNDGTVEINSPEVDISGSLLSLPVSFFDAAALLRNRCGLRSVETKSSFIVAGQGRISPAPDDWQTSSISDQLIESPIGTGKGAQGHMAEPTSLAMFGLPPLTPYDLTCKPL